MSNDWRLTVAESIKRPLFKHAEVVAGGRGLARPIRWVHVLETADSCQYLNGGELILSTGLGFGGEREKRLAYLSELIRRKAVGLCMELGDYIPHIPLDMQELANHHDFPLIVFHQPVRFVDITQDLHEHLINRQMQALRDLEAYSRSLQQLSLQSQGIPRVLQHFQTAVQMQVFLYTPEGTPQYVPPLPQSVQTELTELMRNHFSQIDGTQTSVSSYQLTDTKQIVYQPVMAMGHLLAYLGLVLYERHSDEYLLLTLDSTVSTLAQIMMRKMFVEEQALATENRLFDDLIANRPIPEELMRSHMGLSGTEKPPAYHTMLMSFQKKSNEHVESLPPHDLSAVFRSVLSRLGLRAFIRCTGNRFTFLLVERQPVKDPRRVLEKAMQELERITRQMMGMDTRIWFGIGRIGKRLADAGKHLAEAEQALAFQHEAQSPFFADLGLFRLLFHIPHDPVLQNFIHDYLGPLLAHDQEHSSQLVYTLRVYLDTNLSKQEAAEKLFIHRQTLYHRLEKIAECLGDDYMQPHRRLCLEIALRALDWLQKEKDSPVTK
ncbi:transcriptional regulator [Brevibacillus choshinensis]|uniref:Transcriptional regulator n=1 Tax=Brevibacillus choshinensis TaxID=54911 RepID=A0ABR5N230_BRECH|nr:PucR family transcriptional regulator [Brevibacillus choshinensis]KQL44550.1 transcriptional regulator [Brevibacillus choshinensis]